MDSLPREALLVRLAEELRNRDSWCGETHMQKAAFFLQDLAEVPLGYDFMLYKHGPFSFDLRDEIRELVAYQLFDVETQEPPYGPRFAPNARGQSLASTYPQAANSFATQIEYVASILGSRSAAELEKLGTALWYTVRAQGATPEERAQLVYERKPHIPVDEAREAVREVEQLKRDWEVMAS